MRVLPTEHLFSLSPEGGEQVHPEGLTGQRWSFFHVASATGGGEAAILNHIDDENEILLNIQIGGILPLVIWISLSQLWIICL